MEYKEKLGNVDATLKTTDSLLNLGSPKRWLDLILTVIILLVVLVVSVWLLKKYVKSEVGNLFDILTRPFRTMKERIDSAKKINAMGVSPTLGTGANDTAKAVADDIYSCFTETSDDEMRFYSLLREHVHNAADWEAIKEAYGVRKCPSGAFWGVSHDGNLGHLISHNLTEKECDYARKLLASRGVTKPSF